MNLYKDDSSQNQNLLQSRTSTLNGCSSVKQPSGLYLVPLHSVVAATPANRYEISILALLKVKYAELCHRQTRF